MLRISLGDESTLEVSEVGESTVTNAMVKLSRTLVKRRCTSSRATTSVRIEGEAASEKTGYSRAAEALRNENYNVEKLLLAAKGDVPDDADVVIVAGPTRPLLPQERSALHRYLGRGGRGDGPGRPAREDRSHSKTSSSGAWSIGDDVSRRSPTRRLRTRDDAVRAAIFDDARNHQGFPRDDALQHGAKRSCANPEAGGSSLTEIVFTGAGELGRA